MSSLLVKLLQQIVQLLSFIRTLFLQTAGVCVEVSANKLSWLHMRWVCNLDNSITFDLTEQPQNLSWCETAHIPFIRPESKPGQQAPRLGNISMSDVQVTEPKGF